MNQKTPSEMLEALGKPFPREAVKRKQGKFDYVEHQTVTRRLNSIAADWSFVIRDTWFREDLQMTNRSGQPVITMVVLGELTIPGLGTRSGYGVANLQPGGGEDQYKGAESDALKKAASRFGVALDLYGDDYEGEPAAPQNQHRQAPQPVNSDPDKGAPTHSAGMRRIHAVGNKHGFTHEELRVLCDREEWLANKRRIGSMNDAPEALLNYIADLIEKNPDNQRKWLDQRAKQQQELMPGPDVVPNPNRFTN